MNWPRMHWLVGLLTLALFPMAGVYMRYVAGVPELDGVTRMVASAVILVSPFPLAAAFFIDPGRGVHGSLWSGLTMRSLFVAGALLAFANRPRS